MNHSAEVVTKRKAILKKVKDVAKEKGLTHEALGQAADLKQQTCSRVLIGRFSPYLDTLISLADAAGLEIVLVEKK